MLKFLIFVCLSLFVLNLVVSLIVGHISNYYNPAIRSTYTGFCTSLIGITLCILLLTARYVQYSQNLMIGAGVFLLSFGVLATVFEFLLQFYFGAWGGLTWILLAGGLIYVIKNNYHELQNINSGQAKSTKQIPLNTQINNNLASQGQIEASDQNQNPNKKCCTPKKCSSCCHICCSMTTMLLVAVFTIMSMIYFSNWNQNPPFGQIYTIQQEFNGRKQKYDIHAYCIGEEQTLRPTLLLEHGGGSNSIAFVQLGNYLKDRQWKLCSYDRLGYGRSSVTPRYLSVEQRAEITNKVVNELLKSHTNKNIIMGGWSAGVQISEVYTKLYPTNVQGMLFLDGYPDYLTLMAIQDKKQQKIVANTLGVLWITRALESFGLGLIPGGNPISNTTTSNYYKGYYQTGYFWESQYFDIANPDSLTDWLTSAAGTSAKPYPESQINLNWPDISVPLLVLPANETVTNGQYSQAYKNQCEKFLSKCTNPNKQMSVMQGDHGFVLKNPQKVAEKIDAFFRPLF